MEFSTKVDGNASAKAWILCVLLLTFVSFCLFVWGHLSFQTNV